MSRRTLVRLSLLALLAFAGGLAGFLVYARVALGVTLSGQEAGLRLPPVLEARASATRAVRIRLNGMVDASVPVDQVLVVPLRGTYDARAVSRASVPLDFVIDYRGSIPVRGEAEISGTTDLVWQSRLLPSFPIKVKLPLRFEVPVALRVPVRTVLDVVYDGPMAISLDQVVSARLDTVLKTRFPVDRVVEAPIMASFGLRLHAPDGEVPVVVEHADLRIPLRGLRLHAGEAAEAVPDAGAGVEDAGG